MRQYTIVTQYLDARVELCGGVYQRCTVNRRNCGDSEACVDHGVYTYIINIKMLSVSNVHFSVWQPASILRSSVVAVEQESDLACPKLGVVFGGKCPTCFQTKHSCPGHWGSIRLAEPMYNISWISHLLRLLKKYDGKFFWDKRVSSICKDGKIFPAYRLFELMEDPPVISVLPVPPPHVRPPLFVDGILRGENDLTYRLQNIVRKNTKLLDLLRCNRPPEVVQQGREALQNTITGYINHEKLGSSRHVRNKREYVSITSRIQKKGGRIRYNLMGKRVEFTARCVITPDDGLKLNELGIPESVANTLTIPVRVTDYNKLALQEMVDVGKFKYVCQGKSRSSKALELEVGFVVERFLKDGDVVLFNRQPSLHKYSLMAHHVRILPYDTFRMNVACTSPYNADFDGDEMNVHVPQTILAQAEAEEIMLVSKNIISAQSNCPIIGLIQDALLGVYLLSAATLSRADAMQIAQVPSGVTGREIISTVLPKVTYERGGVKIVEGVFLEGRLRKKDVGKSNGSLVHIIFNDFGSDACVDFIFNLQGLAHRYLQVRGFTIGIKDLVRTKEATDVCNREKVAAFEEAKHLKNPNIRLNNCRAIMGKAVMKDMGDENNFYCMVNSGSKGSIVNITQVQSALGQMNVVGGRIPMHWKDRTATEFKRGDTSPEALGFVASSYLDGLSPFEMFVHSMSGREGLIDTAIKTAQTGYVERKLMKCLENIVAHADGTVRDGQRIIQFKYGDDGFDGARIETQHVHPLPGANQLDLDLLTEDTYHFPVPIRRIVRRMELHGGVRNECGPPVTFVDNRLLRAFINVHTPIMPPLLRERYEQDIQSYLDKALISAGEGVGALAAQSIGERTTQCTLNSVDYNEWLIVKGYPKSCCIGQLIDEIMAERGYREDGHSHVRPVSGLDAFTISADGTVSWKKITHVTRHPPASYRGSKKLIKITTESGKTLIASRAKSFLIVRNGKICAISGTSLEVNDKVPVLRLQPEYGSGFHGFGKMLGAFFSTGRIEGNIIFMPVKMKRFFRFVLERFRSTIEIENDIMKIYSKTLIYMLRGLGDFPTILYDMQENTWIEFCRAYICGKGVVEENCTFVECTSPMKDGLSTFLLAFDIRCRVSPRGIMLDEENTRKLRDVDKPVRGYVQEAIVSIEQVSSSHEYVYDLTVVDTKNMVALNGIACRDTFHFAGIGSKNVTLGIPRLQEILGVTKNTKTPLTTIRDPAALLLKRHVLKDVLVKDCPGDTIGNYWTFPDKGITEEHAHATWGTPKRLTVKADHSILDLFEYCAYHKVGDRFVCDVFGDIPEEMGVPGAEWCKWVDNRVETTLQDFQPIMEMCEKLDTLYTNDIYKMFKTFGVEAARVCVMIEIRKILDHYGIYVNARHLLILVDAMTHGGDLTPLTRHGLKRSEASTLKRCTFEEVVTVLNDAALKNIVDPVDGVSACILTGKVAALGANTVTVLKDHVMEKKYKVDPPVEHGVDTWMPLQTFFAQQSPTYVPQSPTSDPWI